MQLPHPHIQGLPQVTPRQQRWFIVGLIVVAIIAAGGWVWWQFVPPAAPTTYTGPTYPPVTTNFPADFFGRAPYPDLRQHGAYPMEPGVTGRGNPFVPALYVQSSTTPALESLFGQVPATTGSLFQ